MAVATLSASVLLGGGSAGAGIFILSPGDDTIAFINDEDDIVIGRA